LVIQERRVRLLAGAAVSFVVAVALGVQVVTELMALNREYPWEWWADPTVYVVLALPLLPALLGVWLLRRARRG
jgi:hypothetical protein